MSSICALNFKLLIKSDLLLIYFMCIHNSNICFMQTNNVILIFYIILLIFILRIVTIYSSLLDE